MTKFCSPPLELEDGLEYEVASMLDYKIVRNKLYYLVDWRGYSLSNRTWELTENVSNARALLEEFHQQYPSKPCPQRRTTHNTHR